MAYPFKIKTAPFPAAFDNPAPEQIVLFQNDRGSVYTFGTASVLIADEMVKAIPAMQVMKNAFEAIAPKANEALQQYLPKTAEKRIKEQSVQYLRAPFQQAQDGAIRFLEQLELNLAKFESFGPIEDSTLEQAKRDAFNGMEFVQKLSFLHNASIKDVIAVLRIGAELLSLTHDQHEIGMRRVRLYNVAGADAVLTTFTKKPTLKDPLARGLDQDAANEYAEEALKTWDRKKDTVSLARTTLQNVCIFVAAMTGATPEQAYDMLTGANA